MPDAHAVARLPALPETPTARHDDDLAVGRGLVAAVVLSVPLWALIGFAVAVAF